MIYWIAVAKARLAHAALYLGFHVDRENRAHDAAEQFAKAAQLAGESRDLFDATNAPRQRAYPLYVLGRLKTHRQRNREASTLLGKANDLRALIGHPVKQAEVWEALALLDWQCANVARARNYVRKAQMYRVQFGAPVPPCDRPYIDALRRNVGLPPLPA